MQKDIVVFKNTAECFNLILRPEPDFDVISKRIEEKIMSNRDFYKGSSLSLKYSGRNLNSDEEKIIVSIFNTVAGANVLDISSNKSDILNTTDENTQIDRFPDITDNIKDKSISQMVTDAISYSSEGITKFHKGTLRSGQYIGYRGNVVVFGDMNPGAEIVATGNIIVLGLIRGIVRAGVEGDTNSVIAALGLQPSLLSIGDIITRAPEEDKKSKKKDIKLEVAYLKGDAIYISN